MNKFQSFSIFILLVFIFCLSINCVSGTYDIVNFSESDIKIRWTQDGQDYVLVKGDIYLEHNEHEFSYIVKYYNTDFLEKNYFIDREKIYIRYEDNGLKQIRTRNEYNDDFESYQKFLDSMLKKDMLNGTGALIEGITSYDYKKLSTRWSSLTLQSPSAPDVPQYVELRRKIIHEGYDFIDNRIELSGEQEHSSRQSLRFYSVAPSLSMVTSKASISTESVFFKRAMISGFLLGSISKRVYPPLYLILNQYGLRDTVAFGYCLHPMGLHLLS